MVRGQSPGTKMQFKAFYISIFISSKMLFCHFTFFTFNKTHFSLFFSVKCVLGFWTEVTSAKVFQMSEKLSKVAKVTRTCLCFVIKATQENSTSNTVKQQLGRYTKSWLEQQIGSYTVFSDLNS